MILSEMDFWGVWMQFIGVHIPHIPRPHPTPGFAALVNNNNKFNNTALNDMILIVLPSTHLGFYNYS